MVKLGFDERRKKRRTRGEMTIPRVSVCITRLGAEGQDTVYLMPDTVSTQRLSKSTGAIVTIGSIINKMEALDNSRDKVSQHSSGTIFVFPEN